MRRPAAAFSVSPALSIPSSAENPLGRATTRKGLTHPLGDYGPAEGELHMLAPGVGWARIALPGSLRHINIWALDDRDAEGEGVAIVDTGMALDRCKASWAALFAGPLAGKRVTRVIGTHLHPDHIGLAGWLCDRFGVSLWMTRTEWLMARMLEADRRDAPPKEAIGAWRLAGWNSEQIAFATNAGWGRFCTVVSLLPSSYVRIVDGQEIAIGDGRWQVVVGSGHTPEHACLWERDRKLLIAGDQILPRITSNVSVTVSEPLGDPLGDWLASIDRLLDLPDDLLVLPAHGEPFTGLHVRLAALRDGHLGQLDDLVAFLREPRTAVDCFPILFRRELKGDDLYPATGEAMANLRRLEETGRARRVIEDGVARFLAV